MTLRILLVQDQGQLLVNSIAHEPLKEYELKLTHTCPIVVPEIIGFQGIGFMITGQRLRLEKGFPAETY